MLEILDLIENEDGTLDVSLDIDDALYEFLEEEALKENISIEDYLIRSIENFLAEEKIKTNKTQLNV
jgi:hypothetical protein